MTGRQGLLLGSLIVVAAVFFAAACGATIFARHVAAELEHATPLAQLGPRSQSTIVFDRHGRPAFSFFAEQRIDVPLERISPRMIHALLAIEDRRFFSHRGLDPVRIIAATWSNARAGRIVQGGSTLTQQLARAGQLHHDGPSSASCGRR